MATEKWENSLDYDRLLNVLPIDKIEKVLGINPQISILFDEDVKKLKPMDYNMSISTRALNDDMESRLQRYFADFHTKEEYSNLMKVNLPQILWKDNLNLKNTIIGLHISKLRKDELFINDIVLAKNEELDGIKNGIFDMVLNNLFEFAREQNIKYISGHAAVGKVYEIFLEKGFRADRRREFRNNQLWLQGVQVGAQIPFYIEI